MSAARRRILPPGTYDEPPEPPADMDERGRAIYADVSVRLHDRLSWTDTEYTKVLMYCQALAAALKLDEEFEREGAGTHRRRLHKQAAFEWRFARRWAESLGLPEPTRPGVAQPTT